MRTSTLSLNSTVVQRNGNVVSNMDGNMVMLSIEQGKYYSLGSIGGDIWDLMETPAKIDTIVKQLIVGYEVEEAECIEQVIIFIKQLINEELVEVIS